MESTILKRVALLWLQDEAQKKPHNEDRNVVLEMEYGVIATSSTRP